MRTRRGFLKLSVGGATGLALAPRTVLPAEADKSTYVYKRTAGGSIKADVYNASTAGPRPGIVWIHGGALIMGDRGGMDRSLRAELIETGYLVVSIDYRLAPETKLPSILEDVRDAFEWIRKEGPGLFGIAPERIGVMGGSAGGYLTLVTGYRVEPRPSALVSFWGYGDITGPWYSQPDPFYRRQPLVSEKDARAAVGTQEISDGSSQTSRGRFYLYCRQQGLWPKEVAGLDLDTQPRAFDPFCPIRNVTANYPPTLFVHGTKDTDVPYELSVTMDRELARQGVPHELITVPGGGHGLGGTDPAVLADIRRRVLAFVGRRLDAKT
jgi:acetyl esterase/lipase